MWMVAFLRVAGGARCCVNAVGVGGGYPWASHVAVTVPCGPKACFRQRKHITFDHILRALTASCGLLPAGLCTERC